MTRNKTLSVTIWTAAAAAIAMVACTGAQAQQSKPAPIITVQKAPEAAPAGAVQDTFETIDHISPARDSVGKSPVLFQWSAAKGADEYSIGIWNEVDRMVWRRDHIHATSVNRPDDVELEAGTYFWTIAALKDGDQIADSGLAAFVVKTDQ